MGVLCIILYVVGLTFVVFQVRKGRRLLPAFSVVTAAVALFLLASLIPPLTGTGGKEVVTFFDVGQGDAILLNSPGGTTLLLDGGPDGDLIEEKLREEGVEKVDLMISSHPHHDHLEGLNRVLSALTVGAVVYPGLEYDTATYQEFEHLTSEFDLKTEVGRRGQKIRVEEGYTLEVLYSPRDLTRIPENVNDWSLVLMAHWGGIDILFTGDMEEEAREALLEYGDDLDCDVLKVPHQGSDDGMTWELLEQCMPEVALISVGEDNEYGHPSPRVIELLEEFGAHVYRTDRDGDIKVLVDEGEVVVETDNMQ